MTLVHIIAGLLAITAGAVAFSARKGGELHRKSGAVFVCAMMVMASMGGVLAVMQLMSDSSTLPVFQKLNAVAATLTLYLVATAWWTVRRPARGARWIDAGAMAVALAVGSVAVGFAIYSASGPDGKLLGLPAAPALIFGTFALLAALGDTRMLLGRRIEGKVRIARHLWRMGLAMVIATGSFFLGQAKVFPEEIRIFPLLAAPVVLVILATLYWMVRIRITRRIPSRA